MTRATSMMNSVLRSAVAVQNMWNTALLLTQGASRDQTAIADELAREQSKLNDMRAEGIEDTIQFQEQQEKVNELLSRQKQIADDAAQANLNLSFNFATGAALIAGQVVQLIPRMLAMAGVTAATGATYTGALAGMSAANTAFTATSRLAFLTNPWFLLAAAIAIVAVLIITHWDEIVAFFNTYVIPAFQALWKFFEELGFKLVAAGEWIWSRLTKGFENMSAGLTAVWESLVARLSVIWEAWKTAFTGLWQFFANITGAGVNAIVKGVEWFVNSAIDSLNVLIRAYNSAVAIVGGRGISLVPRLTLGSFAIPTITAAAGVDMIVNRPTAFIAGEAGQSEHVRIGAGNNGGGGRGVTVIQVTVQGSIWKERELEDKILRRLEEDLIDRGF